MQCPFSFSKDNAKSLFTPWKLRWIKWFKYLFCAYVFGSDWYLFQLIVFFKPDFHCWSNFVWSWVDKVAPRASSFVSVIVNISSPVELVITQIDEHVKNY